MGGAALALVGRGHGGAAPAMAARDNGGVVPATDVHDVEGPPPDGVGQEKEAVVSTGAAGRISNEPAVADQSIPVSRSRAEYLLMSRVSCWIILSRWRVDTACALLSYSSRKR